jgi:hypothetical protein
MDKKQRLYTCYKYQYAESRHALTGCLLGSHADDVPGEAITEPLIIEAHNKPEALRLYKLQVAQQL